MLGDEITTDLRNIRQQAMFQAVRSGRAVTLPLNSKGINYGSITASPSGSVDYSQIQGLDPDLRANSLWARCTRSWGFEVNDPDLASASAGHKVVTPAGMVLGGTQDKISPPPAPDVATGQYELDPAIVDHLEFYLLNYSNPDWASRTTCWLWGERCSTGSAAVPATSRTCRSITTGALRTWKRIMPR